MIKISKDKQHVVVTRGAYESIYKPLGYTVDVESKKEEIKKPELGYEKENDFKSTKNYSKTSRK